jgi:hypothetical protein
MKITEQARSLPARARRLPRRAAGLPARARRVPALAGAERAVMGVVTRERRLPIADYDSHDVPDIVAKLPAVSQHELRLIAAYETRHANRVGVLEAITALRSDEPWPGYDAQNITAITTTLAGHDAASVREVGAYERAHKDRVGVRAAVEHRSETIRAD